MPPRESVCGLGFRCGEACLLPSALLLSFFLVVLALGGLLARAPLPACPRFHSGSAAGLPARNPSAAYFVRACERPSVLRQLSRYVQAHSCSRARQECKRMPPQRLQMTRSAHGRASPVTLFPAIGRPLPPVCGRSREGDAAVAAAAAAGSPGSPVRRQSRAGAGNTLWPLVLGRRHKAGGKAAWALYLSPGRAIDQQHPTVIRLAVARRQEAAPTWEAAKLSARSRRGEVARLWGTPTSREILWGEARCTLSLPFNRTSKVRE
jgi:hypothetical protein